MALKFKTMEEMQESIVNNEISNNKVAVRLLQINAAKAFSDEFEKTVRDSALNKKLRTFLESEDFSETIYSIILNAGTSQVESDKHFTIKELENLKNYDVKLEELLVICRKIRRTMQNILLSKPEELSKQLKDELDQKIILFQGLFIYYTDNLTRKLGADNN